jgi:Family of unknown function (DUF6350)
MNRSLTALFAAFEALLVVAIGIGISLAPLTLLWGLHYGFAIDWAVFWRASVDIWLLGHGADMTVTLDPATVVLLGLPGAEAPFVLTIAALGFALITVLLGVRAGRRIGETRFRLLGQLVSVGTFAVLSFGASWSAIHPAVRPSVVQGTLLPTLVFGIGVLIGALSSMKAADDDNGSSIRDWIADWPAHIRAGVGGALRGGAASAALVMLVSAVAVAAMFALNYAPMITLYEGLQSRELGGAVLTLGQLAFLPNLVIWAAAWFVGPGFAIGTGSAVSPIATTLGPLPALPVLGALPAGDLAYGFVGLLVPVLAGFVAALGVRGQVVRGSGLPVAGGGASGGGALSGSAGSGGAGSGGLTVWASAIGIGVVGGAVLGVLAWASAGSAGPGRLIDVGPDPLLVFALASLEIAVGALLGMLAGRFVPVVPVRVGATARVSARTSVRTSARTGEGSGAT